MDKTETNGALFDPGYSKFITSFMDVNIQATDILKSIKAANQKAFKYKLIRSQIISTLMREIGFYYGCLLWASYIKYNFKDNPQTILNNSFYGRTQEELDEFDYLKEVNYVLAFFEQYPKDLKYYRCEAKDIDEKYKKVVDIYKKFLILNKSFVETKTTNDLVLPEEIKPIKNNDLETIKSLIDKTVEDGNFDRLFEYIIIN